MPVSPSTVRATRPIGLLVVGVIELLEAAGLVVLAALAIATGPGSRYPETSYGVGGTLLLAAGVGAVVGIVMIAGFGRQRSKPIPFGPYLALGGLAALFFGPALRALWNL